MTGLRKGIGDVLPFFATFQPVVPTARGEGAGLGRPTGRLQQEGS